VADAALGRSAQGLIWKDVVLSAYRARLCRTDRTARRVSGRELAGGISPTTGNPLYTRPIILTLRREDHSFLLDPIMPRPGG